MMCRHVQIDLCLGIEQCSSLTTDQYLAPLEQHTPNKARTHS
jgi:hypothetical protein